MERLPHWVLTNKFPALFDSESATVIEQTARVYGAMQSLIDDYNLFVDKVNEHIQAFEDAATKNYDLFTKGIRQEFQDFIDTVTLKILSQDANINDAIKTVNEAYFYLKQNLPDTVQASVDEWLNDHPEATTTVQDESLTYKKLIPGTLGFVTPQMYGALGDGKTDDTQAFKDALENSSYVYIPSGSYVITDNLTLDQGQIFEGTNDTVLNFTGAYGLLLNNRHITVKHLNLYNTGREGTGITLGGNDSSHYVTLDNVQVVNFSIGMSNTALCWNNTYKSVRFTECDTGIKLNQVGNIANFGLTFINCYTNHCPTALVSTSSLACFISCNFGMTKSGSFNFGNSNLEFTNCNFECDSHVSEGALFISSGKYASFKGCKFLLNCGENCTVFSLYTGNESVIFENCIYAKSSSHTMPDSKFFDASQFNAAVGGVRFIGGCSNMPRPNPYSGQAMNWIDAEKGKPITFYETIATARLSAGMLLYNTKSNKLCYFNGTNVVNADDNTVVC